MATPTLAPAKAKARKLFAFLGITFAGLVLAIAGLAAWFYGAGRAALPQLDGHMRLTGLSQPVAVVRDEHGVPHITASTLPDLFFAQGFVTAQDRLWQMDMVRRYAAGELAEVLGSGYLAHDRQQRTLLIRQAAEKAAAALPTSDRAYFEAYAAGVNACIAQQKHLPIEFRVLRYAPRPWTVSDSFLVATAIVEELNLGMALHILQREKIVARLGPELGADLYPNASWRDRPPTQAPVQFEPSGRDVASYVSTSAGAAPYDEALALQREHSARGQRPMANGVGAPTFTQTGAASTPEFGVPGWGSERVGLGSNNWVLSGAHTLTGKPLLANDMHLRHQIPNTWYEAHLTAGSYDVAGVTLPGFPFVISGHNQRIAWGFTNVGPAVTDLLVESFNDKGQYLAPDGWHESEHHREVIHVRGQRGVVLDITVTRHGPIVSALWPGESRQLALQWTLYDPAALQVPFFAMNTAQNWPEFRAALSRFGSPTQNVVYADVDGHIAYQLAGAIPLRVSGNGSLPVSGSDNAHEWTGYIPFDKLPSVVDPVSGILVTANGRVTPDGYPYVISNEWGPPYRTERIYKGLNGNKRFSAADMLVLQNDVYSDFDRFCAERFVYAIDHAPLVSAVAHRAADLLRNWDGRMSADSAAARIVVAARRQLVSMLLQPKLGADAVDYHWLMSSVWLENTLLRQPARWLPPNYTSFDELLAAAFESALSAAPRDLARWRWGERNEIDLQHPLFGRIPLLRRWSGPGRWPQSGDGYTVKQVGVNGDEAIVGVSERMTVDLANVDASSLNIVTGQSGQIFSPYYQDQWEAWYTGHTFTLSFSPAAVEKSRKHELVLDPN